MSRRALISVVVVAAVVTPPVASMVPAVLMASPVPVPRAPLVAVAEPRPPPKLPTGTCREAGMPIPLSGFSSSRRSCWVTPLLST